MTDQKKPHLTNIHIRASFVCAVCGHICWDEWDEKDADEQMVVTFGEKYRGQPSARVCDPCYARVIKRNPDELS